MDAKTYYMTIVSDCGSLEGGRMVVYQYEIAEYRRLADEFGLHVEFCPIFELKKLTE